MLKENKIICPKCGTEINISDATKNQLNEEKKELTFKDKLAKFIYNNF